MRMPFPDPRQWARRCALAVATIGLAAGFCAAAFAADPMPGMHHAKRAVDCVGIELKCATAATPFIDTHGKLWVAWAAGGAVSVAPSSDDGRSFGPPVVIGRHGELLDVGADARPQVAVDAQGRIVVAYGVFKDKVYNAQVLVSTSLDGGKTFSVPRSLSYDSASQRFPALAVDRDGTTFIAWLDKRTVAAAKQRGVAQPGAAVAYAFSRDGGVSFAAEQIAHDHSCECCRLGVAFDLQHHPVVLFRNIYGERERDHAVLTLTDAMTPGPAHRVAVDRWEIDGCPHHGPSLAVADDGSYHAAWFTLGEARQGLFYARSTDQGRTFSAPQRVGDLEQQAGRPSLLAHGRSVWLAWKEFDGKQIFVKERHSRDSGQTWSADRVVATARGYTDHPLLVGDGHRVFLSWMTHDQGYRLIPLEDL